MSPNLPARRKGTSRAGAPGRHLSVREPGNQRRRPSIHRVPKLLEASTWRIRRKGRDESNTEVRSYFFDKRFATNRQNRDFDDYDTPAFGK